MYYVKCLKEKFELVSRPMKGLVILFGESFRTGNQNSRIRGQVDSYEYQKKTSPSHIDFLQSLPYKCDVLISTYTTQYDDDLLQWYNDYLIDSTIHDHAIGLYNNYSFAINKWRNIFREYDFVFFLRIDLCLKPMFKTVWQTPSDKILYPFICFIPHHKTIHGLPRVSSTMLYVPKNKYDKLFYAQNIPDAFEHDSWFYLMQISVQCSEIGVFLHTYHDADSYKDWNPLYCMLYRQQSLTWHTEGYRFDPITLEPVSTSESYDVINYDI